MSETPEPERVLDPEQTAAFHVAAGHHYAEGVVAPETYDAGGTVPEPRDTAALTTPGADLPDVETVGVGNLFIVSYRDGETADRYIAANRTLGNTPLIRQAADGRVVVVYDLAPQINQKAPPRYRVTPAEVLPPTAT